MHTASQISLIGEEAKERAQLRDIADRAEIGQWRLSCGCEYMIAAYDSPIVFCLDHSLVRWYMELGEC